MASTIDPSRIRQILVRAAILVAFVVTPALVAAQAPIESQNGAAAGVAPRLTFGIFGVPATTVRDSLVHLARQQLGRRYVLGGTTPDKGFDCSGLIRYVLAKLDISVP
ncbi:MAG: C40 family peptidase, partial [Gemmatimonadaceae bacterium]